MTRPIHPFWGYERTKAYTEVALLVCTKDKEPVTESQMINSLSPEALTYAKGLGHAPDETFRDTFFGDIEDLDIITYDSASRSYTLGKIGYALVINFLEEWAGEG